MRLCTKGQLYLETVIQCKGKERTVFETGEGSSSPKTGGQEDGWLPGEK